MSIYEGICFENLQARMKRIKHRKYGTFSRLAEVADVNRRTLDNIMTGSEPSMDKGIAIWLSLNLIEKELDNEMD